MDVTYREWTLGPELADRVACFWTSGLGAGLPGAAGEDVPAVTRVVPDGCMDIIWGPDGLQIAGPDTEAHLFPHRSDTRYVAVRFLPGGAGPIFGVPAGALTDARLPLEARWGRLPDGPDWDRPPGSLDDLTRLRALLTSRLRTTGPPDPAVPAMRAAAAAGSTVRDAAADLGFSERQLRRRSAAAFGYGLKTLQRILRFQQALELARAGTELAQVAYQCGYADQAHLAGEVKRLAGVPMGQLR